MKIKKMRKKRAIIATEELINILNLLSDNVNYKKRNPSPKFTLQEALFIRDLIFHKPHGLLFHYIADEIMNDSSLKQLPMFNAPSMKRLSFLYGFISSRGNATRAAVLAGFSPKTAKQQAHRILREIQGHKRES